MKKKKKIKAKVYINRKIVELNKKTTKKTGVLVDNPAISIRTHLGTIHCQTVGFNGEATLIQDAKSAICTGATIWIDSYFEDLIIDGIKANRSMFSKKENIQKV